jgi:hypothetical protein
MAGEVWIVPHIVVMRENNLGFTCIVATAEEDLGFTLHLSIDRR